MQLESNTATSKKTVLVIGLALFSMFFGAGNLIFPVMIGIESGTNQLPVTLGFLATGVLLPMLGMIAAATSGSGILGLAERISHYPGLAFCWLIFLSTGILYAMPRTAAVSFEMSFGTFSWGNSKVFFWVYIIVFFLVTMIFALNPNRLLDKVGGWLTPVLLFLLIFLIVFSIVTLSPSHDAPSAAYATRPISAGLLNGYNTLDALASFVFGVVIISALKERGCRPGREMFKVVALCGVVAAVLLGSIYFGLSMLGSRVAAVSHQQFGNGGEALSFIAYYLLGNVGLALLAAIAILACLTTSVGLIGASVQFFNGLFPQFGRKQWMIFHVLVSIAVASMGLTLLVKMVVPIMYLCYPITISLICVCLVDIFVPGHLYWSYRLTVWVSAIFGAVDALHQLGYAHKLVEIIPLASIYLGWVLPAGICLIIGFALDAFQGRLSKDMDYDEVARKRNQGLIEAGIGGEQ